MTFPTSLSNTEKDSGPFSNISINASFDALLDHSNLSGR